MRYSRAIPENEWLAGTGVDIVWVRMEPGGVNAVLRATGEALDAMKTHAFEAQERGRDISRLLGPAEVAHEAFTRSFWAPRDSTAVVCDSAGMQRVACSDAAMREFVAMDMTMMRVIEAAAVGPELAAAQEHLEALGGGRP